MAILQRGIYAITDFTSLKDAEVFARTELLLRAGISILQYRDKSATAKAKINRARELRSLCRQFNTPFIVNDDIELARDTGADGIHLGQNDTDIQTAREFLGPIIIGCSCYNSLHLAQEAQAAGADYVAFGAFHNTSSKKNTVKAEPEILERASHEIMLPLVAIGGITPENGKVLVDKGAAMLAVISALYGANDTNATIKKFNLLFEQEQ